MAAGDTLRRITPNDQLIVDINGNVVGVKSPNANGADLRFDSSNIVATGGRLNGVVGGSIGVVGPLADYDISEARLEETIGQFLSLAGLLPLTDQTGNHGSGNGNVVEPSLLYEPGGWNGYKYWLAISPYDSGNANYENPCLLVSNDFSTWVVPPGLTNPIATPPASGHLYDGGLFWAPDKSAMILLYCQLDASGGKIYFSTSTDGVTWTPPVLMQGTSYPTATHYLYTPCLAWDAPNSRWVMYCADNPGSVATQAYPVSLTSNITGGDWRAALAGPWSAPASMTVNGVTINGTNEFAPGETSVWHWDMHQLPGGALVGLLQTVGSGGGRAYPIKVQTANGSPVTTDILCGAQLRPQNLPSTATNMYRGAIAPAGDTWKVLFGTWGYGPLASPNANLLPGTIRFDKSRFRATDSALLSSLTAAPITGTGAALPAYGNGILWDSFNHATFGTPTAGTPTWTVEGGTFAITGNQLTGGTVANNKAYFSSGASDVDIRTVWATVSGAGWVTFRRSDASNYWRVTLGTGAPGFVQIQKIVAGSVVFPTLVANSSTQGKATLTATDAKELRITADGPTIRVYYNKLLIAQVFDPFNEAATTHGVQITDTTAKLASYLLSSL